MSEFFKIILIVVSVFILNSCKALNQSKVSEQLNDTIDNKITHFEDKSIAKFKNILRDITTNKNNQNETFVELKIDSVYLDSLKNVLKETNQVLIEKNKIKYLKHLKPSLEVDTIYLANLYAKTENKSIPISYEYPVNEGDELIFEIQNIRSKKINSIVFKEGNTIRNATSDLKRNKIYKASFISNSNNLVSINITKKGFFKSDFKLLMKVIPAKEKYLLEEVYDSVPLVKKQIEIIQDTVYTIIDDRNMKLSSSLNLLKQNVINMPVSIQLDTLNQLIGWGYWVGVGDQILERYNNLKSVDENMEPLITFGKNELLRRPISYEIPTTLNNDISTKPILNANYTKGLNSNNFNSFYDYQLKDIINPVASLLIENKSKLYEYLISVKILAVYIRKSKQEVDKEIYTPKSYYKLSKVSKNVD